METNKITKQKLDDHVDEIKESLCKYDDYEKFSQEENYEYKKRIENLSERFINKFIAYLHVNKITSKEFEKLRKDYFYDDIGNDFYGFMDKNKSTVDFGFFSSTNLTGEMLHADLSLFEISTLVYLILDMESLRTVVGNINNHFIEKVSLKAIDLWGPDAISKELTEYVGNFGYCIDDFILPNILDKTMHKQKQPRIC